MSSEMIWRYANAFRPGVPVNIDRALGGSYNTRSVLESLLAHNPEFYYCYPGRIMSTSSLSNIEKGHKHLIWLPNDPHKPLVLVKRDVDMVISEIPTSEAVYEALVLPETTIPQGIDIEIKRRHAQMQLALVEIGKHLGYRTWVAKNDKGIIYKGQKLGEMASVIGELNGERVLISHDNQAIQNALYIDCIWFQNSRYMPAVIEIEHSTGVTSGLSRMKKLQDIIPSIMTRWIIAASDEDRDDVLTKANLPQFNSLNTFYFPYSAIEELFMLCQKRKIKGVTQEFIESFMEPCLPGLKP